jgi:hypothetical protein
MTLTMLQQQAIQSPAARAFHVYPEHFERIPPRPGDRWITTIGLSVNR